MARIRTLKPEFATDEKLAKVSRDARLTFVLCITQADDDGLLPGNHRQLLAALYPLDDLVSFQQLAGWLEELVDLGRLRWRETVDGSPILEIVHWADHQKVDHKGKSLILPHLKPVGEEVAKHSRESREDVASVSRSDLGPRTVDLRPTTSAPNGAPPKPTRKPRPSYPDWVPDGVELFAGIAGDVKPAEFYGAMRGMVERHTWIAVRPDFAKWLAERAALGKGTKPAWYAGECTARLAVKPKIRNDDGTLTEYGERITRPEKVSA